MKFSLYISRFSQPSGTIVFTEPVEFQFTVIHDAACYVCYAIKSVGWPICNTTIYMGYSQILQVLSNYVANFYVDHLRHINGPQCNKECCRRGLPAYYRKMSCVTSWEPL